MSNCYVVLKQNHRVDPYMAEKIKDMELPTPEERYPIENEVIEVYFSGTFQECYLHIQKIDSEIRDFFEVKCF